MLFIPWFKLEAIPIPGLPSSIAIQPFGILVVIGVILGARIAEWRAARMGIRREVLSDFITHVVATGFIVAHVFDRVAYDPEILLREPWDLLMPWRSLSSFGGFFGALLGAFLWQKRRGGSIPEPLEQVAFGLPVGWFFGRLGCFVVHDHPGKLTTFFLAVDGYRYGDLPIGPRHDLGLYEVLWSAAVIPLFFLLDRKPRPVGFFTGLIAVLYAPFRFGLDFLRDADATYFGLTPGHYSAILAFILGAWTLARALSTEPTHGFVTGATAAEESPKRARKR